VLGRRYTNMESHIDEDLLRRISKLTGGHYFRAQTGKGLERIFDTIDELETSKIETTIYTDYEELAAPWMWVGLALLILESLLAATVYRVLP
jgi:Ca-activated chloride channel family protein